MADLSALVLYLRHADAVFNSARVLGEELQQYVKLQSKRLFGIGDSEHREKCLELLDKYRSATQYTVDLEVDSLNGIDDVRRQLAEAVRVSKLLTKQTDEDDGCFFIRILGHFVDLNSVAQQGRQSVNTAISNLNLDPAEIYLSKPFVPTSEQEPKESFESDSEERCSETGKDELGYELEVQDDSGSSLSSEEIDSKAVSFESSPTDATSQVDVSPSEKSFEQLENSSPSLDKSNGELAKPTASAVHSTDYRSVNWFGQAYSFTANQAPVVRLLYENWKAGTPDVGDETLLAAVDPEAPPARLATLFRDHPAWKTMIVAGGSKGTHRLTEPATQEEG